MTEIPADFTLPTILPLFPLEGVLLLPEGDLPLNIFEPRYIEMTREALAGDRLIGMIQPCPCPHKMEEGARPYYMTGCVGRISEADETPEGGFLITLRGLSRFHLRSHRLHDKGYRIAVVDFDAFKADLLKPEPVPECLTRHCLIEDLKEYLQKEGLYVDWDLAEKVPDRRFYTLLAMVCPFSAAEKQALLEAPSFEERCQLLKSLLQLACAEKNGPSKDKPC